MTIWLGLQLSGEIQLPRLSGPCNNESFFSPREFVQWLAGFYGLQYPGGDIEFLRSEQYRQVCQLHLAAHPTAFYAASFRADQRATATELLSRRDELISAGFFLHREPDAFPARIRILGELEQLLLNEENDFQFYDGFADRLRQLTLAVKQGKHPQLLIKLHEPISFLPPGLALLLHELQQQGAKIESIDPPREVRATTDLARWQERLRQGGKGQLKISGDGSLVLLRANRETHIAAYLARTLRNNENWKPDLLLSSRNQTLNDALTMEGLPDLGVPVSSLGRPSLQVLKLITVFLWEPIDLRKVMEFLNLIVKPLDDHLAKRLARTLADIPGLYSEKWFITVNTYFNETLPERLTYDRKLDEEAIKEQFATWFKRKRYPQDQAIPKMEVRRIFGFLLQWARERAGNQEGANKLVLQTLGAQAERVIELIDTLPEDQLNYLEVERLVRTVYEPAATRFREPEVGSLSTCFSPAAVYDQVEELIWWDFIEQDPNYFFSRWTVTERNFFTAQNIQLFTPVQQNDRLNWQQQRPVLHTANRLVLCLPDRVNGETALPHALFGELEAAFGEDGVKQISIDIDATGEAPPLLGSLRAPAFSPQPVEPLPLPRPNVRLTRAAALAARDQETPTSIDKLLYYPYQWVFQYKLGLRSNDILDVATDNRLRGNLSHRLLEKLLNARGKSTWTRQEVNDWITENYDKLLRQEGAVLLQYGREPERVQLLNILRYAAWSLVDMIQKNHWEVAHTEHQLEGEVAGIPLTGRSDLELTRNKGQETAIVDLKWRGKSVFRNVIKSQEDIQLCLYMNLKVAGPDNSSKDHTVHTAYFIIQDGLMIGRNTLAFQDVDPVSPDLDHQEVSREIVKKIGKTYQWRHEQLAGGIVEIRCEATAGLLEDEYLDTTPIDDLLEMKNEDARFDHYRALIGLIR